MLVQGGGLGASASLAGTGGKRPSWNPGEGKVKASRKGSSRECCSPHLYTRHEKLVWGCWEGYG